MHSCSLQELRWGWSHWVQPSQVEFYCSDHGSLLDLLGFLTNLLHVWDSDSCGDVNVLFPFLPYFQGNSVSSQAKTVVVLRPLLK